MSTGNYMAFPSVHFVLEIINRLFIGWEKFQKSHISATESIKYGIIC